MIWRNTHFLHLYLSNFTLLDHGVEKQSDHRMTIWWAPRLQRKVRCCCYETIWWWDILVCVLYNTFRDNGDFNIPNYFDENYNGGYDVDWMRNSSPAIDLVSKRNNNPRSPWTMIDQNHHPKNLFDANYRPLYKGNRVDAMGGASWW